MLKAEVEELLLWNRRGVPLNTPDNEGITEHLWERHPLVAWAFLKRLIFSSLYLLPGRPIKKWRFLLQKNSINTLKLSYSHTTNFLALSHSYLYHNFIIILSSINRTRNTNKLSKLSAYYIWKQLIEAPHFCLQNECFTNRSWFTASSSASLRKSTFDNEFLSKAFSLCNKPMRPYSVISTIYKSLR